MNQEKKELIEQGYAVKCDVCGRLPFSCKCQPPIETDGGEGMRGWETRFEKYFALDRDCGHANYKCKCRAAVVDSIKHFMADEFSSLQSQVLERVEREMEAMQIDKDFTITMFGGVKDTKPGLRKLGKREGLEKAKEIINEVFKL